MRRLMIWLRRGALVVEWLLGILWRVVDWFLPRRPIRPMVDVYNALRYPGGFYFFGRVLAEKPLQPPKPEDGKWVNFKRMASQWMTRELAGVEVVVRAGDEEHRLISDGEGYVSLAVSSEVILERLVVSLCDVSYEREVDLIGAGDEVERVVISDVDDTLMETGAISLGKMLKTTLFGNSLTRELVAGTPEVLRELHDGGRNPVFYVTSSPWNLANFLKRVFKRAELPKGGLFMTDWGLTPDYWLTPHHDVHKREAIDRVVGWYPQVGLVLLGDDSQLDPEIYVKALEDYGAERISAVVIRSVSGEMRAGKVRELFARVNGELGERAFLIKESGEMRVALEMGDLG